MSRLPSTTQNARKTISERSGNGSPESVLSGIASAAASVTPPLMPAHAMKATNCQGGAGSRARRLGDIHRGTYANWNPQTILARSTSAHVNAA
jgi:hypothetical protein